MTRSTGKARTRAIRRKPRSCCPPGFGGDLVDTPQCEVAQLAASSMPDRYAGRCRDDLLRRAARAQEARQRAGVQPAAGAGRRREARVRTAPGHRARPGRRDGAAGHLSAEDDVSQHQRRSQTGSRVDHDLGRPDRTGARPLALEQENGDRAGSVCPPATRGCRTCASPTSCSGEAALPATYSSVSWQEPDAQPAEAVPRRSRR